MAEETKTELSDDEAEALDRLLEEGGAPEEEEGAEAGGGKKKLLLIGVGVLVLVLGGVAAWFFLFSGDEAVEDQETIEETVEEEEPEEKKVIPEAKPNIYTMDPFFLPLRKNGKETGKFIHVTVNLLLSNQKLDKEVDNVLPLMRQTIYSLLRRKRPQDFENQKRSIEDRLKSEIVTSTNALLVSGSGKIDEVFFTEFVVR